MRRKKATKKNIDEWIGRMRVALGEDERSIMRKKVYVTKHCPYRHDNFCDGRGTDAKFANKSPCLFFVDGKCVRELHKGAGNEEE